MKKEVDIGKIATCGGWAPRRSDHTFSHYHQIKSLQREGVLNQAIGTRFTVGFNPKEDLLAI